MYTLTLHEQFFDHTPQTIISSGALRVITKRYSSGIASLTIANERGHVEVLPFMGQIIWDAVFDGHSLRMKNMFPEPRPATEITDTYGCFAFHSGLLAAGCPSPDDDHPLHGEFPCAPMQEAWLEITEDSIRVVSMREYVKGFGHHYRAMPSVKLAAGSAQFDIELAVTNLSEYQPMPLQYMCHMNYAFVEGGQMSQSLPEGAFQLRRSIPAHVTPTARWKDINTQILAGEIDADSLDVAKEFDPEIVYFADDLPSYGDNLEFTLASPEGYAFFVEFSSKDFPVATRWLLYNADQQVAAFVLPGTSRPEGRIAAQKCGMLIELKAGETRNFTVTTGVKN
ncbi:aldose 1-epimerase family protein [Trueperella pyogenes]|uniref:aldose 1-epimerase family protein n=1 Tax=Trueperella pyogenes TaxID=1661 RepID=UPI00345DA9B4